MSRENRIKLAKAMGWTNLDVCGHTLIGTDTDGTRGVAPDPFHDANDDYSVLGWMRKERERFATCYLLTTRTRWSYKVGDYARAALTVLKSDD